MAKVAPATVLVVDDDDDVREMAVFVLSDAGYTVIEASHGPAALEILEDHPEIALLFTDVVMPRMNGFELAAQAKQMRPDIRVIYTSGYLGKIPFGDHGVGHGPLIQKPWKSNQMLAVIQGIMG